MMTLRRFWTWVTSYPMRYEGNAFTDIVNGKSVGRFIDRHGNNWLAHGRWSAFRVERGK
jgi:hypothetical protein